ncbi:cytochrome b [Novosphingobium flavum]|uniref:Cytochrome b n=1 Tax=Novosphingobium flavum TaxID=1778672 RepID=A0A7X1KL22_9SPHN|nr:cytochrome b [Novosphingobium flavum]MBC2665141.1 cytochrome b [Novosphingobium flavum]
MTTGLDLKYALRARVLHWTIAALILFNLATGLLHDPLEDVINLIPVHKSVGLTVLVLSVLRLALRLTWTAPPYPATMTAFEVGAARAVHAALYLFMVLMPLSGWIMSSAGTRPLAWFGLFDWPKLAVVKDSALHVAGREFHEIGGWVLLVLALGHIAAALRHHFVIRDGILRRML